MRTSENPVSCLACPLVDCSGLSAPDPSQLKFLDGFKQGEVLVDKGGSVLEQGQFHPHLYTLLEGVLICYRQLDDSRRQIVNFRFPGDLVGMQAAFTDEVGHAVEALASARLCIFPRDRLTELIGSHPRLGLDLIWLAAKQETELEQHIVSLGQRNARERVASLAVWLLERALATDTADDGNRLALSIRQSQIADMLGLSLVHTNRTIKALAREGVVDWRSREICIPDMDKAAEFASFDRTPSAVRPYI